MPSCFGRQIVAGAFWSDRPSRLEASYEERPGRTPNPLMPPTGHGSSVIHSCYADLLACFALPHAPPIAVGHPFAATGGRIVTTLANEMQRRDARCGLISICGAGGTAVAMILERD